jgi:imidazolonepropionase
MLRVIKQLQKESPIPVKATFLGAHAIPMEYKNDRQAYIREVKDRMLPQVAQEGLAAYMDVFCERGFFTQEETETLLAAGKQYGLKPKVHANELGFTGGVQAGVNQGAVSVDHLECTGADEIAALRDTDTIPVLLPSTAFFLDIDPPPARQMADAGLPVALSTDYNPGSCPSGSMPFTNALGCVKLKLLPEESFNAATVNAAHAIEMAETHGHIRKGAAGNVFITDPVPSYTFLPYSFGNEHLAEVFVNGERYPGH